MSPHAATFDDALRWLDLFLGWAPGADWMELRLWRPGRDITWWHHCGVRGSGQRLVDVVRSADERWSYEVQLGVPVTRRRGGTTVATAFWAVTSSPKEIARLERFKPQPSLVLRAGSGSMRVAIWPLEHEIRWQGVNRGNRRLAHWLGTPKKHTEPEKLWIPAPGTCLRRDRARPAPVVVERLEVDTFQPLDVIGRLKDAPDPDAWMKARQQAR